MSSERQWIRVGPDPLRYEYGRENPNPTGPPVKDQLAYVERERAGYFRWETYTDPHYTGSEPDRRRAQVKALGKLEDIGALS
jgi:hypothetical protein